MNEEFSRGVRIVLALSVIFTGSFGCSKVTPSAKMLPSGSAPTAASVAPGVPVDSRAVNIDPVCEMSLGNGTVTDVVTYEGKKYGFCSSYCKSQFEKDAASYVAKIKKQQK